MCIDFRLADDTCPVMKDNTASNVIGNAGVFSKREYIGWQTGQWSVA